MLLAHWITGGAVVLCCIAAWWDLRYRKIPNALTLPAIVAALCLHGAFHAGQGLLLSLAGALAAGALVLPGYALGFTGGGDLKLLMAVGALLAFPNAIVAGLLALVIGGVLGLVTAARTRRLRDSLMRTLHLGHWIALRAAKVPLARPEGSGVRVPFGVAIALATAITSWNSWLGSAR